jgi:hypothetical protein
LEDSGGSAGPRTETLLRFDDSAPSAPSPGSPSGWIAGDQPALLRIGHPQGTPPISGIRGYAISTDDGGGSSPCLVSDHCTLAETDLGGGVDDDSISFGSLPQGLTVARVVAVSGAGVPSAVRTASFRVDATPPSISLTGVPDGWANGPVRVEASAADPLSGMAAAGPSGPFTAIAVDGGAPASASGERVATVVSGSGNHSTLSFARDAAGNVADGAALGFDPAGAVVRIDEEDPDIAFAPAQDPAEPERLEATVLDARSGPSATRGSIGVRPAGSRGRFENLSTEVAGGGLVAHWDSDSYPVGRYEFLATGYDAAGNVATSSSRARGGRMILVNPLKAPVSIAAGFGGRSLTWQECRRSRRGRRCHRRSTRDFGSRPPRRTVPFSRGVRFGGRLVTGSDNPLAAREVVVIESFQPGSEPARRTTVVHTGVDGTFSLRLAPGPSRDVAASFAGDRLLTRATAKAVHLEVLTGVRFRASATRAVVGGPAVVFSGRILRLGSAIPARGRPIQLQFRYPGADWSEFRTVQTDSVGRFRYPYSFSDDDSRGVRFQFRAYAPALDGWPYEAAYSRPVSVTGG